MSYLFYPSRDRIDGANFDLAHTAFDLPSASERPGNGQQEIVKALMDNQKLLPSNSDPPAPKYVRDQTTLKKGQISLDREIVGHLALKQSSDLILWDSSQRAAKGSLGSPDGSRTMIDALHHAANRARSNGLEAAKKLLESNQVDKNPDFQTALAAMLEVLPVSSTFTGFDEEQGELAEAEGRF